MLYETNSKNHRIQIQLNGVYGALDDPTMRVLTK